MTFLLLLDLRKQNMTTIMVQNDGKHCLMEPEVRVLIDKQKRFISYNLMQVYNAGKIKVSSESKKL